ncbi:hypothetical protein C8F04DRAFT_1402460, partial [Mycena alexandri]
RQRQPPADDPPRACSKDVIARSSISTSCRRLSSRPSPVLSCPFCACCVRHCSCRPPPACNVKPRIPWPRLSVSFSSWTTSASSRSSVCVAAPSWLASRSYTCFPSLPPLCAPLPLPNIGR